MIIEHRVPSSKPAPNTQNHFSHRSSMPSTTYITKKLEKDGLFSFAGVEADTYEVSVSRRADDEYVERVTATGAKVSGQAVKVEGPGEVQIVVVLGSGMGKVSGVVKKAEKNGRGHGVAGAAGGKKPGTRCVHQIRAMANGTFALSRIRPGKYVLMAIEDEWDLEWREEEVLKPYREKGMIIEVGAHEEMN